MANTYLSRSVSTNGNRQKFTISLWVKKSEILSGTTKYLFTQGSDSANNFALYFDSNNTLGFWDYGSAYNGRLVTNRLFRDVNAWYHIVVRVDTTLATADDRMRLYINGVQETDFGTRVNPSQNYNTHVNQSGNAVHLGWYTTGSGYFNGLMSHVHLCDGYSYAPTEFGETDSTTGEWKIKTEPSVSYGTNGFWWLKDNTNTTDNSPNSNTFTVANGTLTPTKDCPSNVFATINVLGRQAAGYTIENGNLSTNGNGSNVWRGLYGTIGASSGKFYYEFKLNTTYSNSGNSIEVGVADAETMIQITSSNGRIANAARGYAYEQGGTKRNNGTSTTYGNRINVGDIVGVAVDLDNSKLYFHRNGTYEDSGDPTSGSTGTGAISIASGYTYVPAFSSFYSADDIQLNFGNGYFGTTAVSSAGTNASNIGTFEYNVPAGYTAFSTKGLNE